MKQQKFNRTERDVLVQQKYLRNCYIFCSMLTKIGSEHCNERFCKSACAIVKYKLHHVPHARNN